MPTRPLVLLSSLPLALWLTVASAAADLPRDAKTAMETIDTERIRAHVKFLASDALEGRGTGTRGGEIAAQYIATQFELLGLKPAGDAFGSYFQKVPLVGVTTDPAASSLQVAAAGGSPRHFRFLDDAVFWSETQTPAADVTAPMVFVGYGVQAPPYRWDDYKGFDVRGKILLMLVNDPPSEDPNFFGGKGLTYYGRWTYKYEIAAKLGAAGAILIHTTEGAGYGWDVVRNSWGRERPMVALDDRSPRPLAVAGWFTEAAARELVGAAGEDLDTLRRAALTADFRPVPLRATATAHVVSGLRNLETANVLGRLEGSDPKLREQVVILSAHYDHLGIGTEVNGDRIHNGCVDNASGVGVLLEVAHAFSRSPVRQRRSLLFMGVAAEEGGLRGSEYFATHPTVPLAKIAADVNMDGLPLDGEPLDFVFIGGARSSLKASIDRAANELGFEISEDAHPEQGFFYRSDQFSFARAGVPGVLIDAGMKYRGRPEGWGEAKFKEYNEKDYHRPSDEYRAEMDFSGAAAIGRIAFHLAWQTACADGLPAWNPGDEFEAARRRSLAASE